MHRKTKMSDILYLMRHLSLKAALVVSAVLISMALWSRFMGNVAPSPTLVAIPRMDNATYNEVFLSTATTTPSAPISRTDLVARQLFSDYAQLVSTGKPSSQQLNSLAERYAEGISNQTMIVSAKKANFADVLVVSDTAENLYAYGKSMAALRTKYAVMAEEDYKDSGTVNPANGTLDSFAKSVADLYTTSAHDALRVQVPISLAANHLAIVNNYFESATAMESIAEASKDPIGAFAAIKIQIANSQKENELFLNIQIAMMSNGVTP